MSSQGSETAIDRVFGSLAYLLPIADVYFFGIFIFQQFPIIGDIYQPLAPLIALNNGFAGFFLFLALYLGVAVNPKISRFVRFNVFQAILIGILISLCRLLLQSVLLKIIGDGPITQVLMNTVFFGTWAMSIYGIVMSAMGKYTEIPQLSETAQLQIDRY
jgi:Chloroplast import apparatus Tic20-like